jgi:hypothetical protein
VHGLPRAAHAQPSKPARLPVTVDGKHVKTIDVHSHCLFHDATILMGEAGAKALTPPINNSTEAYLVIQDRLKAMDSQAIDMEVLSINPFWYGTDRDVAEKIVTIQNDKLAELVASKPDRFAAFASLTMQDPALAAQQLETAMKKQGLKGAAIGDRVGGDEFSNSKFDPVWAKAEELGAVLFIHPQGLPELNDRLAGQHHRQPAGHHDRPAAPDLRRLARQIPPPEAARGTRRRLPWVIRATIGSRVPGRAHFVRSQHPSEEATHRIPEADLLRLPGIHPRSPPPPRRAGRHQPDHAR